VAVATRNESSPPLPAVFIGLRLNKLVL